jgi:large subunit ribosomal protein L10
VIKNRLAKRAAPGTPMEKLVDHLNGPCALATHDTDPVAVAKVISEFGKQNPELEVLAGVVDGRELLDQAAVKQLAKLPGLPELRAQILAMLQTPATSLVRLLGTPGSQLARSIDARREKLEAEG